MKSLRYKIVQAAPAAAIVSLYKEAGWWRESPRVRRSIPAMIRGSTCFMIAETDTGEIEGMGRVISDGTSDAYIQDVVVSKAYRGRGVGSELVSRLAKFCKARRFGWIGLVAAPGKTGFYKALGFTELKKHVAMRRL
jgi:ribosomal protein S18 acetylase RimI-like enzyme